MLYKSRRDQVHFRQTDGNVDPWRYAWLMELAQQKWSHLPKLSSVSIKEYPLEDITGIPLIEWRPQDVMDVFKNAKVRLSIFLRPPMEFRPIADHDPTGG